MSAATLTNSSTGVISRNLANVLTSLRLALAAPIAALVIRSSMATLLLAAALFAAAALTDLLDGHVARRRRSVSMLGGFLDPIADKCVLDACIVALMLGHAFPPGLALLLIGRDLAVTSLRLTRSSQPSLFAPRRLAKLKTCALYLGVGGLILGRLTGGPILVSSWLLVAGGALLSLLSAAQYLRSAYSGRQADQSARPC